MSSSRLVGATSLLLLGLVGLAVSPGHAVMIFSRPSQIPDLAQESNEYAPGELIIGLGTQSKDTLRELMKSWGGDIVDELPEINAFLVRFDGWAVAAALYERAALAGFEYVEPNYYVHSTFTPNDPLWSGQWAPRIVRADLAWDIELGEKSVIVAVIDTGINYDHEDLAENYLPSGYDWVNHDNDPMDDNIIGHGTHVAGIIGAVTNNAAGVAGLAQISIMAEKVLNSVGAGTVYDVAEGVIHAANQGARLTNNSYGTYVYSDTMRAAFEYASSLGVLNVAAAGNGNTNQPFYPAAFGEFVISVAGTDQNDGKAPFSNHGDWVELSAPAVNIISTLPGDSYGTLTGTSMASALVAGVAALVWSHFQILSEHQVRQRLQETAVDLGGPGRDPFFGYGRVDIFCALNMQLNPPVGGIVLETHSRVFFVLCIEVAATMGPASGMVLLKLRRKKKTLSCRDGCQHLHRAFGTLPK